MSFDSIVLFFTSEEFNEEIRRKTQNYESLIQTDKDLLKLIESKDTELKTKSYEYENQIKELNQIQDYWKQRFGFKEEAYRLMNEAFDGSVEDEDEDTSSKEPLLLNQKNKELEDIQKDIESIEQQINEIKENKEKV